jgi:hypothetical protein
VGSHSGCFYATEESGAIHYVSISKCEGWTPCYAKILISELLHMDIFGVEYYPTGALSCLYPCIASDVKCPVSHFGIQN